MGKTIPAKPIPENLHLIADRFWKKVDVTGPDDCWVWTAATTQGGYGVFRIGPAPGELHRAHRIAFALSGQFLASDQLLRHKCDTPRCCNPRHLVQGLPLDNSTDMVSRGRSRKGVNNPCVKLTENQVRQIRALYKPYKFSRYKVAKAVGISSGAVLNVLNGSNWSHLE